MACASPAGATTLPRERAFRGPPNLTRGEHARAGPAAADTENVSIHSGTARATDPAAHALQLSLTAPIEARVVDEAPLRTVVADDDALARRLIRETLQRADITVV